MNSLNLKGMIEKVINDLANNTPIDEYALKIEFIAKHLKNSKFSNWIKNELNGYDINTPLPPCRIIHTQIIADLFIDNGVKALSLKGHTMPLAQLGKELADKFSTIELRDSVISLSKIMTSDSSIGCTITEYERYHLNNIYAHSNILRAYKPLQQTDCLNVIYKFKSNLLDIFMEFNDTLFDNELNFELMNKNKDIEKVINQVINTGVYVSEHSTASISSTNIVGGEKNTINITKETKNDLQDIIKKIELLSKDIEFDREDIANEITRIQVELNNTIQKPQIIKSALNAIKGIAIGVGANQITPLVNEALDKILKNF